jgi:transposase
MEDTNEFFAGILGIADPWTVAGVERDEAGGQVVLEVEFDRSRAGDLGGHLHGYVDREWRHLDTCQYRTVIRARVPRVKRPDGTTAEVEVPWADRFSRVTRLLEARALEVLGEARSHSSAARLLGMGEGQLDRIMARAVERGLARREEEAIAHVGMDEKAARRGHRYVTVVTDIGRGVVVDLVEGRDGEAASSAWKCLSPRQRDSVEAVAMDMWPAYMKAAEIWVPDADAVHDRFHVAKHLGEAVDAVRKAEHRALMKQGDDTLKGMKYSFLRRFDDLRRAPASFNAVRRSALSTAKAWAYKETFDRFWSYVSLPWAEKFFQSWFRSAIHTKLEPVKKVARMLKKHLPGLLAYVRHRITNATAEGINSKIQMLKSNARGLPKFRTLRIRVLFHCGGLDLSPHTI